MTQIVDDVLAHNLGLPVGTVTFQPRGFGDGNDRRFAVDSCRRRVDQTRAFELGHDLEQSDGSGDVVGIVRERDFGGFSNGFQCLYDI